MEPLTSVGKIIADFGGMTKLARLLDCPVTTVQGWKERNKIPQERWLDVMNAAKSEGRTIAFEEFLSEASAA